jgi:hypothetical protein
MRVSLIDTFAPRTKAHLYRVIMAQRQSHDGKQTQSFHDTPPMECRYPQWSYLHGRGK